jgi:hypothetical protein
LSPSFVYSRIYIRIYIYIFTCLISYVCNSSLSVYCKYILYTPQQIRRLRTVTKVTMVPVTSPMCTRPPEQHADMPTKHSKVRDVFAFSTPVHTATCFTKVSIEGSLEQHGLDRRTARKAFGSASKIPPIICTHAHRQQQLSHTNSQTAGA